VIGPTAVVVCAVLVIWAAWAYIRRDAEREARLRREFIEREMRQKYRRWHPPPPHGPDDDQDFLDSLGGHK
jgi:protein-S-isoprenylcysteine O-methyltransferase Ste14